jgi:hypothetical protein
MGSNIDPNGTRVLGWYAIRWTHITDWFKVTYTNRRHNSRARIFPDTPQQPLPEAATTQQGRSETSDKQKLEDAVEESRSLLVTTKSVFPFTLFPDVITIDRHKLTIVYRTFLGVEQTVSVPIENIKNIQADIGPFLGSLTITSDHFINNTQTVNYLRRDDAKKIQKLVQGAMVAIKEKINISKIDTEELNKLLSELGEGHIDS